MAGKYFKASKVFNKFLKITLGSYMRHLFGFKIYNGQIAGMKPPYIVLANHTNFWDPFLLSMCIPEPVYFVTNDAYFRNPLLKQLLKLVGAIPKTKSVSDPSSIKSIVTISKNNGIIGIFPEGKRNWDGTTLPLLHPTAKLIKSLGLPVVTILFKGAYLSMPRWARKTRKGKLTMTCSKVLESEEVIKLSSDEIYDKISTSVSHDEYEYQKQCMNPYTARLPAEKLELFLFCCPKCKSMGSMRSSNDIFFCKQCNYSVQYDTYGFLCKKSDSLIYDNPRDWNNWQLKCMEAIIEEKLKVNNDGYILDDHGIIGYTGFKSKPLKHLGKGSLYFDGDKISFNGLSGTILTFDIKGIYGENIQGNNKLEFHYEKSLYRFYGKPSISAYKWVKGIELAKKVRNKGGYL
jgi:1-acyl-sn-glycerol-3-phosphate acyltransferase